MINALIMHPKDDVAVVTTAVVKGGDVTYVIEDWEITITAAEDIPVYHKIAVRDVKQGDNVYKYGEVIGRATAEIKAGTHVHTQNLTDLAEKAGDIR